MVKAEIEGTRMKTYVHMSVIMSSLFPLYQYSIKCSTYHYFNMLLFNMSLLHKHNSTFYQLFNQTTKVFTKLTKTKHNSSAYIVDTLLLP